MPTSLGGATSATKHRPDSDSLLLLGRMLQQLSYQFTTVTPATHQLVNARPSNRVAASLRDVFGWSRPFEPGVLPTELFQVMRSAGACEPVAGTGRWRPLIRFSTLNGLLLAHSAFPTIEQDAVFFGPDSYRFVRAIEAHSLAATRIVDVGCGSGVGGIALAKTGTGVAPVVLADINHGALRLAQVNAQLAFVRAETVHSDILQGVRGEFDLVIANPPYLRDESQRVYRDGGGEHGEGLAVRIVRESIDRLSAMRMGGQLLLYTGAAIVDGEDTFLRSARCELNRPGIRYSYDELDPDVFAEELERPAYAGVERIAAVLLRVQVTRAN
ncbi:MAG: class I SAM-dependent methyltransferase [Myxococcales bacterium]